MDARTTLTKELDSLTLSAAARVWIYMANRTLTHQEQSLVANHLQSFAKSWAAHGVTLHAEGAVLMNQVVVLAVDESVQAVTGCSVDASVSMLRSASQLTESLGDLDLLDRSWVLYIDEENQGWSRKKLHDFWAMRKAGTLKDDTVIFDSTVKTLGELRMEGCKALSDSWHAHMW